MIKRSGWETIRSRWRLLGIAVFLTTLSICGIYHVLDGEFETRRHGVLTPAGTPVRFAFMVLGTMGLLAMSGFAWLMVRYGPEEPRYQVKVELDDPSKRSPL